MRRTYLFRCNKGRTKEQYLRLRGLMEWFIRIPGAYNNERRFKGMKPFRFRVMKDVEKLYKKKILT